MSPRANEPVAPPATFAQASPGECSLTLRNASRGDHQLTISELKKISDVASLYCSAKSIDPYSELRFFCLGKEISANENVKKFDNKVILVMVN